MAKGAFDEFQDNCSIHRELKSKLVLQKYSDVFKYADMFKYTDTLLAL